MSKELVIWQTGEIFIVVFRVISLNTPYFHKLSISNFILSLHLWLPVALSIFSAKYVLVIGGTLWPNLYFWVVSLIYPFINFIILRSFLGFLTIFHAHVYPLFSIRFIFSTYQAIVTGSFFLRVESGSQVLSTLSHSTWSMIQLPCFYATISIWTPIIPDVGHQPIIRLPVPDWASPIFVLHVYISVVVYLFPHYILAMYI